MDSGCFEKTYSSVEDFSEVLLVKEKVMNEGFIKHIGEDHRQVGDSRVETALLSLQVLFGDGLSFWNWWKLCWLS